jgi:hypothetical protein
VGYTESGQVDSEFNVVWMEKKKDESGYEESVPFFVTRALITGFFRRIQRLIELQRIVLSAL